MANESVPRHLNAPPTEGYGLLVDGKLKSHYPTLEAATTAARELKKKFPLIQVALFDAATQTRTVVALPEEAS